jgi:hypothetical protein
MGISFRGESSQIEIGAIVGNLRHPLAGLEGRAF